MQSFSWVVGMGLMGMSTVHASLAHPALDINPLNRHTSVPLVLVQGQQIQKQSSGLASILSTGWSCVAQAVRAAPLATWTHDLGQEKSLSSVRPPWPLMAQLAQVVPDDKPILEDTQDPLPSPSPLGNSLTVSAAPESGVTVNPGTLRTLRDFSSNPMMHGSFGDVFSNPLLVGNVWGDVALPQGRPFPAWVEQDLLATSQALDEQLAKAREEGNPYVLWVNPASYLLRVFDASSGTLVLQSRVIVGAPRTQTPLFATHIVNIKFNPDWSPPSSIRASYTPPGPRNPLGQARFSTDNAQNIYLHDTNNHQLFDKDVRALSHGCVRVEEWHALAQLLLNSNPETIDTHVEGNATHYVDIPDSLVWISYHRLDLDEMGQLSVFADPYHKQDLPDDEVLAPVLLEQAQEASGQEASGTATLGNQGSSEAIQSR